jgi:hypothetical protein
MATWALNAWHGAGAHVLVVERVKIGHSIGTSGCRGLRRRESEWRRLGASVQSQFFGRQQLRGRQVEAAFCADHGQGYHGSRQLRGAHTTTEKIVGGLRQQQKKEPGKRRLMLLRHAKSSWADRSLKGNSEHNPLPLILHIGSHQKLPESWFWATINICETVKNGVI